MAGNEPCSHLAGGRLEVVLSLDDYLGVGEAVMRCPLCGQCYLVELLDIRESRRAFRLSVLDQRIADQLVHDLTRGGCDSRRSATEVQAVKALSPQSSFWLITQHGSFAELELIRTDTPLPTSNWRDLPLDGCWLETRIQ